MISFIYRIGIALLLSGTLFGALFGFDALWKKDLDIQLHNTYFILSTYTGQISFFAVCLLLVCLLDMLRRQAANSSGILLTIGSCAALLVLLSTDAAILLASMQNVGWTVYPPLEASAENMVVSQPPTSLENWTDVVRVAQLLFLLVTIWAGVTFGKLQARQKI